MIRKDTLTKNRRSKCSPRCQPASSCSTNTTSRAPLEPQYPLQGLRSGRWILQVENLSYQALKAERRHYTFVAVVSGVQRFDEPLTVSDRNRAERHDM